MDERERQRAEFREPKSIREIIDQAPPLTPEVRAKLAAMLALVRPGPDR